MEELPITRFQKIKQHFKQLTNRVILLLSTRRGQAIVVMFCFGIIGVTLLIRSFALPAADSGGTCADVTSTVDFKPMLGIGNKVCKITTGDHAGLFRVVLDDGSVFLTHGGDNMKGVADTGGVTYNVSDQIKVQPTCSSDYYFEIIYAVPSGESDQFENRLTGVRDTVAYANGTIHREGDKFGRNINMKVKCDANGRVAVGRLALATSSHTISDIVNELKTKGFTASNVKYVIWLEGDNPPNTSLTGVAYMPPNGNGGGVKENPNNGTGYAVIYRNGGNYGVDGLVMTHEATHAMGGVQNSAPHSSGSAHCNDGYDVMCYGDDGPKSTYTTTSCGGSGAKHYSNYYYDCNHDDYFNPQAPAGSYLKDHWNLGGGENLYFSNVAGSDCTSEPSVSRSSTTTACTKRVQTLLNNFEYGLSVDGAWGNTTQNAVTTFQGKCGFTQDGVVGPNTWSALHNSSGCGRNTSTPPSNPPVAIQGNKVGPGNNGNAAVKDALIVYEGGERGASTSTNTNPYSFNDVSAGLSRIHANDYPGWRLAGFTLCYGRTNCHNDPLQAMNNDPNSSDYHDVVVDTRNGYADLWFHYEPISVSSRLTGYSPIITAQSRHTCIDVAGGPRDNAPNGTRIALYSCGNTTNQQWASFADGTVRSKASGKCLDVIRDDRHFSDGVEVQLWDCTGDDNQQWDFYTDTGAICSRAGDYYAKCLDARGPSDANDTQIQIWEEGDPLLTNQKWLRSTAPILWIQGVASKRCLDLRDGIDANYTVVQIYDCQYSNPNQQWLIKNYGNGVNEIRSNAGSKTRCLDLPNGQANDGQDLWLYECNGSASQKWVIDSAGWIGSSINRKKILDVEGPSNANRAIVQVWEDAGRSNQRWKIQK